MERATAGARLDRIDACVFDAYGTLFDVHSAVARVGVPADLAAPLSETWRDRQLHYTWLRSLMGEHADFARVTADALDYALAAVGVEDSSLREPLLAAYRTLDAYPEVAGVLARLRGAGVRIAILSNGAPAMLEAGVRSAGLTELLEAVLSAEEVGVYKPDPRVYQLAVDRLGVPADRLCFLSANGWDAAGAAAFGFRVAWVNRSGAPPERLPGVPRPELRSLAELPALLGIER